MSRNAIIGVVACLCVLQGLVFAVSGHGRLSERLHAESGLLVSSVGEICSTQTQDDGRPPAHVHSDCCILCSSSAHDGLLRFVAALFDIALSPPLSSNAARAWPFADDPIAPLAGWTSSWSSRAPPFFS